MGPLRRGLAWKRPEPEELRCLAGWLAALDSAGLLAETDHRGHHLVEEARERAEAMGADRFLRALRRLEGAWGPWGPFRSGGTVAGYWPRTYLALVPLPPARGWDRRMCRLVEMQIAATVDRTFWSSPPGRHDDGHRATGAGPGGPARVHARRGAARGRGVPRPAPGVRGPRP